MNIKENAMRVLSLCGERVEVETENGTLEVLASIQPLRYKYKSYFTENYIEAGNIDDRNYVYMGDPRARLDNLPFDTIIRTETDTFVVKRAEKVCLGTEIIYIWAMLQRYIEEVE